MKEDLNKVLSALNRLINSSAIEKKKGEFIDELNTYYKDLKHIFDGMSNNRSD